MKHVPTCWSWSSIETCERQTRQKHRTSLSLYSRVVQHNSERHIRHPERRPPAGGDKMWKTLSEKKQQLYISRDRTLHFSGYLPGNSFVCLVIVTHRRSAVLSSPPAAVRPWRRYRIQIDIHLLQLRLDAGGCSHLAGNLSLINIFIRRLQCWRICWDMRWD